MKWELLSFEYGIVWHDRGAEDKDCCRIVLKTPYSLADASDLDSAVILASNDLGQYLGDMKPRTAKATRELVRNDWRHDHDRFNYSYSFKNGRWVVSYYDKSGDTDPGDVLAMLEDMKEQQ